jgi:hypothetical protein
MSESHHHRSLFNKSQKPFKGKSKGKARRKFAGRVAKVSVTRHTEVDVAKRKADRVNRARQLQKV